MAICKYFQSGYCRFGSKCINEHFDVKQYIKTEVEAALKGSQWPLSCFGVFKQKPCIPNFIEDQSYEEVRLMCYNARKENCFPAYQQQFTQQVMDAQNKMKALLSFRREVIDGLIKLYDDAEIAQKGGAGADNGQVQNGAGQSNPFSLSSSALAQPSSGGLFGAASNQMGSFSGQGLSGGGLLAQSSFGGTTFAGAATQGSIFGGQQQQQQPQQQPQQQANTFSFSQAAQPSGVPQQGGNIFSMGAQPQQQQQISGGSIFGGALQQQSQQQQSLFGGGGGSVFGGNTTQTNLFGQAAPVQQQQPQQNLFGQTQQPPQGGFGAFGQTQTPVGGGGGGFGVQQQVGLFGQQPQQPQQQMQMQQQQQPPNQQQQGGVFGAPQQNLFGQQQQAPQQASAQGNMFAETQQAQMFNMGQQQSSGMFGTPPATQPNGNVFGQVAPPFQQAAPQQHPNMFSVMAVSDSVYSKLEDLTAEEIEAFKAPEFVLGKIPTKPPPRELV